MALVARITETHRAVAHALATRNGLAPPHRRCTRFAQVPAESAEVEAADVARSAVRRTVKSHGPSRRPGRRVHSPNWASRRGSKQALHSLAHLVLLSLASGFRIPLDPPLTSDSSCSGGSCGVGRRQLSVSNCDKCDESCAGCGSEHGSNGASKCNTSCNHKLGSGTCSGTHTGPDGPRSDGPCNDNSYCPPCDPGDDCDASFMGASRCSGWCDMGCTSGCASGCNGGCDHECDTGCSCPTGQYHNTGATKSRHSPHHHHSRLFRATTRHRTAAQRCVHARARRSGGARLQQRQHHHGRHVRGVHGLQCADYLHGI